ncbi:hypothetical protein AVEN_131230-1 [Araneus ventricosus]|uniref:Uncharacterized protein n=1 Tax=Araneus ventricosus TaxID=182803 RepID=A0A4Y2IPP1_ARAVE|nr:hypothetical protein AVEN_131230-1 [Araneus ventricosus]
MGAEERGLKSAGREKWGIESSVAVHSRARSPLDLGLTEAMAQAGGTDAHGEGGRVPKKEVSVRRWEGGGNSPSSMPYYRLETNLKTYGMDKLLFMVLGVSSQPQERSRNYEYMRVRFTKILQEQP